MLLIVTEAKFRIQPAIKWLLRTDADHDIGLGHLQRTINLAQRSQAFGVDPVLVLKYRSTVALEFASAFPFQIHTVPQSLSLGQERRWIDNLVQAHRASALIFDISHGKTSREPTALNNYLTKRPDLTTCVIDGMGDNQLLKGEKGNVELVILPYVGAPYVPSTTGLLYGSQYVIVADAMRRCAERHTREPSLQPRHLLLTAGGSDPHGITELALGALLTTSVLKSLDVRVVLGPLFGKERELRLRASMKQDRHVEYVIAPKNLCGELKWADIVISATGLTKYEIALFGAPAVFVSSDLDHHRANQDFDALGTGIHVGPVGQISSDDIANAVSLLVTDSEFRSDIARRGRNLIDGRGADRLVTAILSERHNWSHS